jgi:hypothetical protein
MIPQQILVPAAANPIPENTMVHTDLLVKKSEDLTEFTDDFDNQFEAFPQ